MIAYIDEKARPANYPCLNYLPAVLIVTTDEHSAVCRIKSETPQSDSDVVRINALFELIERNLSTT